MDAISSCHAALPPGDGAPDWVQLIPAGTFSGSDGRGPYVLDDAAAVIASSAGKSGVRMVMCENHATDIAVKTGCAAPARGWITELAARGEGAEGGIWGRVEWTGEGRRLVAAHEYRGISPVFMHDEASGRVLRLLRASLTNVPNLDVATLHHQQGTSMTLLEQLRTALSLPATADDAAVVQATSAAMTAIAAHSAELGRISTAVGVAAGTGADGIVTALQSRGAGSLNEVVALQAQVMELRSAHARTIAVGVVTAALKAGKPIPEARVEQVITQHMADPKGTEAWLEMLPSINAGGLGNRQPPATAGGLTPEEMGVVQMMGLDPAAFLKAKAGQAIAQGVA